MPMVICMMAPSTGLQVREGSCNEEFSRRRAAADRDVRRLRQQGTARQVCASFCFTIRSLQLYYIMHPLSFICPNMHFENLLIHWEKELNEIEKPTRGTTNKQASGASSSGGAQHTSRRKMRSLLYFSCHAHGEAKSASPSEFGRLCLRQNCCFAADRVVCHSDRLLLRTKIIFVRMFVGVVAWSCVPFSFAR
jgi:hypothetical protein